MFSSNGYPLYFVIEGIVITAGPCLTARAITETKECAPTIARSGVIGTIVGILPGSGATISAFLCYIMNKRISKRGNEFGTGIPGSGTAAVLGYFMAKYKYPTSNMLLAFVLTPTIEKNF